MNTNFPRSLIDLLNFGQRNDGTNKGQGYFGVLRNNQGNPSTEIGIGMEMDGKETELPSMNPYQSRYLLDWLLHNYGDFDFKSPEGRQVLDNTARWGRDRMKQGLPVWRQDSEPDTPVPQMNMNDFLNELKMKFLP